MLKDTLTVLKEILLRDCQRHVPNSVREPQHNKYLWAETMLWMSLVRRERFFF